jgi:hypothetical protein
MMRAHVRGRHPDNADQQHGTLCVPSGGCFGASCLA